MRLPTTSLLLLVLSTQAFAFGDDVCFFPAFDQPVTTCFQLPDPCLDSAGTNDTQCANSVLMDAAQVGGNTDILRSSLHTDVTFVLAQAVGFSADDAFWIASYNQAMDHGVYIPRDITGAPLGDNFPATENIDGLNRGSFGTAGNLLHFVPTGEGQENGLQPDVHNPHDEPVLTHVRLWAADKNNKSRPLCASGITNVSNQGDYATGSNCFQTPEQDNASLVIEILNVQNNVNRILSETGVHILQIGDTDTGVPEVLADQFDRYIGAEHAKNARLGVYLHVLQDRISHHKCTDNSPLTGPGIDQSRWFADLSNEDCAQDVHVLRHSYEQATNYDELPPEDQTTRAALTATWDELAYFAQLRKLKKTSINAQAVVDQIAQGLKVEDAVTRLTTIARTACRYNLTPYPGVIANCESVE